MKTLIVYATKHGATRVVAERVAAGLSGAVLCELGRDSVSSLEPYDCVVLGSPLYAGAVRKEFKDFLEKNAASLRNKKLGLFLCGLEAEKADEAFAGNFPKDLLRSAPVMGFLGGVFDPKKAGFFERTVMKAVAKHTAFFDNVSDTAVARFVEQLRG